MVNFLSFLMLVESIPCFSTSTRFYLDYYTFQYLGGRKVICVRFMLPIVFTANRPKPGITGMSGFTKASLAFSVPDKPVSLFACLKIMSDRGINLSRLESRPIQG
jgi:hypothetical protein